MTVARATGPWVPQPHQEVPPTTLRGPRDMPAASPAYPPGGTLVFVAGDAATPTRRNPMPKISRPLYRRHDSLCLSSAIVAAVHVADRDDAGMFVGWDRVL